jgi:hypothetical protein
MILFYSRVRTHCCCVEDGLADDEEEGGTAVAEASTSCNGCNPELREGIEVPEPGSPDLVAIGVAGIGS